jgi:GNAT superfamily N-acetyltransferase
VTISFPAGLVVRAPVLADAEAVAALLRADEDATVGQAFTTPEDLRSDWRRPSLDLSQDVVVVADGARLVGYADTSSGRAWVAVHPDAWGRGIGTALLAWTEAQARRQHQPRVGQTVADGHTAAIDLLTRSGYRPRWESWVFSIDLDDRLVRPALPDGLVLRPMVRPDEDAAVHRVIEDAFAEWPDRDTGQSFADWRAAHLDRADAEALIVAGPEGVLGAAVCIDEGAGEGWVEELAVVRAQRCCTVRSTDSPSGGAPPPACRPTRGREPRPCTSTWECG